MSKGKNSHSESVRIVTMLPSATEIIDGIGQAGNLVARSHECDFPPEIQKLPIATFANIDSKATSQVIDTEVQSRLASGLSLYGIHQELLRDLQPDFIVTQTQCDVCAVSLADVKSFLKEEVGIDAELIVLAPNTLEEVWQDIRNVSQTVGVPQRGLDLVADLEERLHSIQSQSQSLPRPRVAMIEWTEPLMAAGNWVPQLVSIAGGENLLGKTGVHSNWMTEDDLIVANPDLIIVTPCGFDLERTKTEMTALTRLPRWTQLNAVKNKQVFAVDGNAFFNRPGPRLVESAEILAEILHPTHFSFGHSGIAWQQFTP
jgi:iron complex transport system substrate-binding protein